MTNENLTRTTSASDAGDRLDRFLGRVLPDGGLRAARRLIGRGAVTVDGVPRPAAHKLRLGQTVSVRRRDPDREPSPAPRLVQATGDFAALLKPAGLHTVRQTGSDEASLEDALPGLFPGKPLLLANRLDRDTSGIVLAAFSAEALARFRALEADGRVEKLYLTLVSPPLAGPTVLTRALDTAGGTAVRVLDRDDPDPGRHTRVVPLDVPDGAGLVLARIARGARHQIRAHMARTGHPIVGDPLYGDPGRRPPAWAVPGRLYLHHLRIRFEGFSAQIPPDWPELGLDLTRLPTSNQGDAPCAP